MRNDICKTYIQKRATVDGDKSAQLILDHLLENENTEITDKITNDELKAALADTITSLNNIREFNEQNRDSGNWSAEVEEQIQITSNKLVNILAGI